MTHESILILLTWIANLTGYSIPDKLPEIKIVSEEWMGNRACPENPNKCAVYGLYDDKDVIYVIDGLTWKAEDHIVLHELTHYLQHHSGKFNLESCIDTDKREKEAYRMETLYISTVQNDFIVMLTPPAVCTRP